MTKKSFIALADTIRDFNQVRKSAPSYMTPFTPAQINALADFCASQNAAFKRDRWLGYIAGTNGQNGGTK